MYGALAKRLAGYQGAALLGLFLAQYLMVLTGPALIVLGGWLWNPFLVLAGLFALRLLFLFCDLQKDVAEHLVSKADAKNRM